MIHRTSLGAVGQLSIARLKASSCRELEHMNNRPLTLDVSQESHHSHCPHCAMFLIYPRIRRLDVDSTLLQNVTPYSLDLIFSCISFNTIFDSSNSPIISECKLVNQPGLNIVSHDKGVALSHLRRGQTMIVYDRCPVFLHWRETGNSHETPVVLRGHDDRAGHEASSFCDHP